MPYQNRCRRDRNRSSSEYTSEMLCGTGRIVESSWASAVRLEFFLPRYWLTWLGLGVLRGIERLPFGAQRSLAPGLGHPIRRPPLAHVRLAARHIALSVPQLSAAERGSLLERHCRSLGMGLCETATTWWSRDARGGRLAPGEGLGHLQRPLAQRRRRTSRRGSRARAPTPCSSPTPSTSFPAPMPCTMLSAFMRCSRRRSA